MASLELSLKDPESVQDRIEKELRDLVEHYSRAHGSTAEFSFQRGSPVVSNDGHLVELLRPAAAAVVGQESLLAEPPEMGAEDFSYYAKVAPTAYALIGSGNRELESDFPHHHPRFTIDERALGIGLRFLLESVERTSSAQSRLTS